MSTSAPDLPPALAIPRERDGAPVFTEPWEARTFALVVELNRQGRFAWKEFVAVLAAEIAHSEAEGLGRPYYLNWHIAAERLIERTHLAARTEIDAVVETLRPDDRTIRLR